MVARTDLRSIYSQNCQGVRTDVALEELLDGVASRHAFVACLQETWRCGFESFELNGFTFLGIGPDKPLSKRGSQGVSITLSHRATEAWKRAGCEKHMDLGPGI